MDNQKDTFTGDAQNVTAQLPFHSFFNVLKSNGFALTTQQIIDANKAIIFYADRIKNEDELCLSLLPIFAANEDEQILFKQLFLKHFKASFTYEGHTQTKKEALEKHIKKNWKKFVIIYGLVAVILVTFIIIIYQKFTTPNPAKITVSLKSPGIITKTGYHANSFSVNPNQNLEVNTVWTYKAKRKNFPITTNTIFDWGDNSILDNKNIHSYKTPGKYDLVAYVDVLYKNKIIKKDTLRRLVLVCSEANSLKINYGKTNRFRINEAVRMTASVDRANPPDYIKWTSQGRDVYGFTYQTAFKIPGNYTISCLAVYDSLNSPCTVQQNIQLLVVTAGQADNKGQPIPDTMDNFQDQDPIEKKKTASPLLFYLYLTLAIVFGILTILFTVLSEREKINLGNLQKTVLEKYNKLTAPFMGKKTPGVIPFRDKNYIPVHQSEINYAARLMRKRVNDNSKFLHIDKTIRKSINNSGLFQPVVIPRTRQTEYLVLIDENSSNSQLVKIFEYLILEFKKQNILVDKYYYRNEPGYCYSFTQPGGVSLEKLYTRHENHVLLILGDAHQLIYKFYPVFDKEYLVLLDRWQYKAVLTPVPYPDWGNKEKNILMPEIPVFPLDVEGLLLMAEYLAENEHNRDIISRLKQHKSIFYKVDGIDFEVIEELEKYCGNAKWAFRNITGKPINILFQWIAALAVYPKISWEITIAIGKSILQKYNCVTELNFTNLLRIARISWMKEGAFPDSIRFELLKQLTTENEKLARETILVLLKEIPAKEIEETSSAYEEKEVQQIINEFSLYAHDPVFYTKYKQSKYIFEKLWNEKKLRDSPARSYFKNADTKWKTLINTESRDDNSIVNVGIEEYFEINEKEETILSRFYLLLSLISLFVFISSLFALRILYQWKTATDV